MSWKAREVMETGERELLVMVMTQRGRMTFCINEIAKCCGKRGEVTQIQTKKIFKLIREYGTPEDIMVVDEYMAHADNKLAVKQWEASKR